MAKATKRHRGGASCLCPQCQASTHVVVTRREETGDVRRVRECIKCEFKFQTMETPVEVRA